MVGSRSLLVALIALLAVGCDSSESLEEPVSALAFPGDGIGKADVFGRALAGLAAPYEADFSLSASEGELRTNLAFRREIGWDIAFRVLDSVPLLGLADAEDEDGQEITLESGDVPEVPRWQTWYGADEIRRMFAHLLGGLTPADRSKRTPFTAEAIDEAFEWNASALDRSQRWPLDRFFKHVEQLGICAPDLSAAECAQTLQSNFSGGTSGNARITYAPQTVRHLLANYGTLMTCNEQMATTVMSATPDSADDSFADCLAEEFPADSVLIKAHWSRADFGRTLVTFDTDGETLRKVTGPGSSADWAEGDRESDPGPDSIFTISMGNGDIFRLSGIHIMTKELRHWVWVTLWWSDTPNQDFGEDRPTLPNNVAPVWANYKMGVVVDYLESDPSAVDRLQNFPSLSDAVEATSGPYTWLSNPYIEHGRGNARTNCVGCHQHGGAVNGPDLNGDESENLLDLEMIIGDSNLFPANGREQMREVFATDYLWSTQRVDNIAQVFRSEIGNFDFTDQALPEVRAIALTEMEGDAEAGEVFFKAQCTPCHGTDATGIGSAANLLERVPLLSDETLANTLLLGKSAMPAWAKETNDDLADVMAFLRVLTAEESLNDEAESDSF